MKRLCQLQTLDARSQAQVSLTTSEAVTTLTRKALVLARSPRPILLRAEVGSGCDGLTHLIHDHHRRPGRAVRLRLPTLDGSTDPSLMIGLMQAVENAIVEAAGGTLLIEDIADVPLPIQLALADQIDRLQERDGSRNDEVRPAHLVFCTGQTVEGLTERLHPELQHRILQPHLRIPPLRERQCDILALARHCMADAARLLGTPVPRFHHAALSCLIDYPFPGNLLELESLAFELVTTHENHRIPSEALSRLVAGRDPVAAADHLIFSSRLPTIDDAIQQLLAEAMHRSKGNQSAASRLLGISRQALNQRLRRSQRPPARTSR